MGTGGASVNNNGLIGSATGPAVAVLSGAATLNNNSLGIVDGAIEGLGTTTVNNFGIWKNAAGSSVGTLVSTGTVAFGKTGSFGTLTVAGNATFGAAATTTFRIDSTGASDEILVGGKTTINGGTLVLQGNGGTFVNGTRYTLISSTGAITGNFSLAVSNIPTLLPILGTGDGTIFVDLAQYDYRALATTRNQLAAATMMTSAPTVPLSPAGKGLLLGLSVATPAQVAATLTQMAGDGLTAANTTALRQGAMFMDTVNEQEAFWRSREPIDPNGITIGLPAATSAYLEPAWYTGKPNPIRVQPAPAGLDRTWRLWGAGFGGTQNVADNAFDGSAGQSARIYGAAFGLDAQVNRNLLVGIAGGYSVGSFSVPDRATTGQVDGAHVALYSTFTAGPMYGAINFAYSSFANSTTRNVATPALPAERDEAQFHSKEARLRLEMGSRIGLGGMVSITPFTALQAATLTSNAYVESGNSGIGPSLMSLAVTGHTTTSLPVEIGFRADAQLRMGAATLTPWAQVAFIHEFLTARNNSETLVAIPGAAQQVYGPKAAQNIVQLKGGAQFNITRTASLFVSGQADLAANQWVFGGKGGFRYGW
jgi:uncharacterized protein with beta-barrel porin domain